MPSSANSASVHSKSSKETLSGAEREKGTVHSVPLYRQEVESVVSHPGTLISLPVEKKVEPSSLEDQTHIWAGYEQEVLPEKTQGRFVRNLRHQILYLYRRIFGVIFLTNLGIFISVAVKGANTPQLGLIVIGNLFVTILMRQDYVIDAFFVVFTAIPPSWPLAIRRVCARVYHIGGIHSGTGVSGVMWLILFAARATQEYLRGENTSLALVIVTYCILALLLIILAFAYPRLRKKIHDSFEATHRFLGWTGVALVWVQIVLLANDWKAPGQSLGDTLVHGAPLWLLSIMTASLALPWIRLRKVNVVSERLSNHAVRMYFDYATPKPGSFVRLSTSPLAEWHSFATISEPGKTGFSVVVSRAGDWTVKQIAELPNQIWKRGVPTFGVMRVASMFRRVVLVATGSGIGPIMPHVLAARMPIRLLWTAPNVRETFGNKLVDAVLAAEPNAIIYNTREHGKPDMVKLTYRLVKDFDAEAVVIISNQPLTEKVVYGMMSRGIPAFGAIWDS